MIKIFPSLLPGEPIETFDVSGITVGEWLTANVPDYSPELPAQPITVAVGGVTLAPEAWGDAHIIEGTCVEIRVLPRKSVGRALSSVISAVVKVVSSLFSWLTPSIPGQQSGRGSEQGSSIYNPNAQANTPKLGDVIPEIAGQHKVFPDYLCPPRRYFVDEKTQALDLMLCVGKGHFDLDADELRIGATPVGRLGATVDYQVFEPGQSVTGHPGHRHWYSAPEVGSTTGGSGLRLLSDRDVDQQWGGSLTFEDDTISGSSVPDGWTTGIDLDIAIPIDVEVIDESPYQTFRAHFKWLGLSVGAELYVRSPGSDIARRHRVAAYAEGGPGSLDNIQLEVETLSGGWTPINSYPSGSQTLVFMRRSTGGGPAPYRITDITSGVATVQLYVNGSPLSGWSGWSPTLTTSSAVVRISTAIDGGIWSNVFLACPPNETTTRIEWDIFAPQGLGYVNDDGNLESRSRVVELQYRPAGGSTWTTVSRSISGRTRDQLGWTFVVNLPSAITPEVRVRRVEAEDNDTRAMDRLEWLSLRSELPAATSYPGATTLAMTITGSNAISGQTENRVSCVVTRRLEPLGGGSLTATRSIAAWVRYVAHSIGYTDADLDMDELARLDGIWSARGDTFDFVHDGDSTVKQVLSRCLRCGFADLTFDDGLLTPVRDEPRSTFEQMYTPQNMTGPLQRGVTLLRPDDLDGVDVEYFDATTWTNETVECRLPGDAGIRPEKIRLEGITNRTRAWRIGMRERRRLRYARWAYRFSTEMDALNSRLLSYVALGDDVPGYGQSALLEQVVTEGGETHMLISEPVQWQEGESHVLAWRKPDGNLAGPYPVSPGDDEHHVVVDLGGASPPTVDRRRELPHILIGTTSRWTFPALIRRIRPRGMDSVTVEAENYDARIYEDDDNAP